MRSPQTMDQVIRFWARWHPDRVALKFEGKATTWRELDSQSDELAEGLRQSGLGRGDRLGILLDNCPEYVQLIAAGLKLGAIVVPLNVRHSATELAGPIADSEMSVLVTERAMVDRVEGADKLVPLLRTYLVDSGDSDDLAKVRVPGAAPVFVALDAADPAYICYTSGTTGEPKGAVITHANLTAAGLQKAHADALTHLDVTYLPFSLSFTGGIVSVLSVITFWAGATLILERGSFESEHALELIEKERVTFFTAVPFLYESMLRNERFESTDLSTWRVATCGGAPIPPHLLAVYQTRGVAMNSGYGLTEATGALTGLNPATCGAHRMTTAGQAMMFTSVAIMDEEDQILPPGVPGEIVGRGPQVMKEYWNRPDATATAMRRGWLHTGDIGHIDSDGYVTVVDRKKDMLISGGLNVYPAEIEHSLSPVLTSIVDYTVIGVPDERWGEVPAIVIGGDASAVDVRGLAERSRANLADYKRPRFLIPHGEPLPRTMSGKVLKRELRQIYSNVPHTAINLAISHASKT